MHTHDPQRLIILWRRVQWAQAIIEATNLEAVAILGRLHALAPASGSIDNLLGKAVDARALFNRPIVDVAGMAVVGAAADARWATRG
jgi:sensor c-di-GMP phosphodiesterase-like protein